MGDLQQDQQGLRDRLKKLQEELAKRGMGPGPARPARSTGPATGSGRRRRKPAMTRMGSAPPTTRWAMPAASSARATPMARSIRRARRWMPCARARRASPQAMQQQDGDGQGNGPGAPRRPPAGRRQPERSAGTAVARQGFRRRSDGEDSRRDRRAAGAPDSRRASPAPRRSAASADRTRLHRAAAEGLLRSLASFTSLRAKRRTSVTSWNWIASSYAPQASDASALP